MSEAVGAVQPPLLEVKNLRTWLALRRGTVKAVDGISFSLGQGQTLGIVGESGSGKTMTALSLLRLLPKPAGRILEGSSIRLDGTELLQLTDAQMQQWRGSRISMISQDPQSSLNPVFTVGDQVAAPFRAHMPQLSKTEVRNASIDVLRRLAIASPEQRLRNYPHQFSGGMRQRVVAAMAIACSPRLLIADEPTSNLDVTIQVQIMELFREIQRETSVGIILVTHDLGVAAGICDRIAVMYAGRIVEIADVRTIFRAPRHPYTVALLNTIPRLGQRNARLQAIEGQPPSLMALPAGCRFAARCPRRMPICETDPPDFEREDGHRIACWLESGKVSESEVK